MGKLIIVGMADLNLSKGDDSLITYGLGSCMGITLYDAARRIGGMAHIMLPSSTSATDSSSKAKFADTAIEELYKKMIAMGAMRGQMVAKLAGGAHMFTTGTASMDVIKVGQRNASACQEILRKAGIRVIAEETGGNYGRTIELQIATGQLLIKTIGHGSKII